MFQGFCWSAPDTFPFHLFRRDSMIMAETTRLVALLAR